MSGFDELGFAKIDNHRPVRRGFPEAVFCEGKTPDQVAQIVQKMNEGERNILATRASRQTFDAVQKLTPEAEYHESARLIVVRKETIEPDPDRVILVVTAGTSDIPVAEEAAITAELMGHKVDRVFDVGVAGIHRLFAQHEKLSQANVLVVCAGMEGALASVVGGLVSKPVIAVPTSVGYGASFNGIAALLGMLNSCAAGVSVVNIDNGFGAGRLAGMINSMR
ncbi:nickel pincer cofactor biosynthesis protein LarB [Tichowtungia aerotolerans]|uniref:nickel pincer cofactor biosynthesis protein LarB n=1 Tax=Tichowtungia aerotolerans TaxID=2697043 RepID=UPI001E59BBB7|nr:nickel pincer cofactor biosynthesis protein LarB [Tichowtungia aerotolerans]